MNPVTFSADEAGLTSTAFVNPDDDTVRFALADWCDGNGQRSRAAYFGVFFHELILYIDPLLA